MGYQAQFHLTHEIYFMKVQLNIVFILESNTRGNNFAVRMSYRDNPQNQVQDS